MSPKMKIPSVKIPDLKVPAMKLPGMKVPAVKIPKLKIPNISELKQFITNIIDKLKSGKPPNQMDSQAKSVGRPMKFPYTISAKIAQFPFKFYVNNNWMWKYYFISVLVCAPLFYKIQKLATSPANQAKWAEIRRKEAEEHH